MKFESENHVRVVLHSQKFFHAMNLELFSATFFLLLFPLRWRTEETTATSALIRKEKEEITASENHHISEVLRKRRTYGFNKSTSMHNML